MHASDMLVHVHTRKLSCVLDPALILATPGGIKLALRLTHVVEPWLTRTFWQLIDSSDWLRAVLPNEDADAAVAPRSDVLGAWIEMREQTDAASWPFRWIGDRLAESQLLDHADACLIEHYEALADSSPPAPSAVAASAAWTGPRTGTRARRASTRCRCRRRSMPR